MISLDSILNNAYSAACTALDETVEEIYTVSKENFVPIDKGDLKASAKNELIEDTNNSHTREISYGTDHAVYVHEILRYYHPHGSAKYLEIPVSLYQDKLSENIISSMEDALDN